MILIVCGDEIRSDNMICARSHRVTWSLAALMSAASLTLLFPMYCPSEENGTHRHESYDSLRLQALERLNAFITAFAFSPETVQMAVEEIHHVRRTEAEAARSLSMLLEEAGRPQPSREEYEEMRVRLMESWSQPTEKRVILITNFNDLYRFESIQNASMAPWVEETEGVRQILLIQSEDQHWFVIPSERRAQQRPGQFSPEEFIPLMRYGSWGPCDRFLRFGNAMQILRDTQGIDHAERVDGEITAQATMTPGSPRTVVFGFSENPPDQSTLIDWLIFSHASSGGATLYTLSDWRDVGGTVRPMEIHRTSWRDIDEAVPRTREALSPFPPRHTYTYRALRLRFNEPLDESLFAYTPPDDFRVTAQEADGSWNVLQVPDRDSASSGRARPGLSQRQQGIQDRLAQAQSPRGWVTSLSIGGAALLATALLIIGLRSIRRQP